MECIDSTWNPGEAVCTDSSPGPDDVSPVEGDHFQCTFFRKPKHESMLLNENPPPFNSSDSEVEFDDPKFTMGWAEISSINSDTFYSYDEEISQQDNKALDLPRVTFGQIYIRSDDTPKQHLEKQLTKPEVVQLTDEKSYPKEDNNLKNKNSEKEKVLLAKCVHNNRYTRAFPDPRYSFNGTKRSYNPASSTNETAGKRRKMFENRAIKYKRLLKSMENVIHTLSEQESIKPRYKVAETNLVKTDLHKEQSQKIVVDNPQADELEMRRPIFKRPELEKFLDESMHRAVKMYRTCRNTWDGINEEKLEVSGDFPKIKNCAWKVFLENQESFGNQESIINSNHEVSQNKNYDLESSKNLNSISTRKWQIMLTSADCTIKKHCLGWQIYLKNVKATEGKEFACRLSDTIMNSRANLESVKTANAEIHCNRDDLDDLLREYEKQNEQAHGRIILRDYLKLLTNEETKVNFILKVLTKAVNDHKIFVIYGTFPVLRKPLGKRGWIEKRFIRRLLSSSLEMSEAGLETIEKLLRCPADFIWYTNKKAGVRTDERTIVNKFSGCYFTSKVDMCNNLENVCWYYEAGVSNIQFPRCYNVYQAVQIQEFIQDFYITACMGILKWFVFLASIAGPSNACSSNGTVPIKAILFALERCAEYISVCEHEDIDGQKYKSLSSSDWALFLVWHEQLLHRHETLEKNEGIDIEELLRFTVNTLREMTQRRPQSHIDGMRNVWILKPGDKSLGRGILLKNSLKGILSKIHQTTKECMQYVVQKYIERPLLVHKTKVDVRQWFLITSTQPLIVWMYKDILLRFASKDFTLKSFHESIHLCNTTVQLKYRKTLKQNAQIPSELHWNLQKFKEYLKATNRESAWEMLIEPGIKQNLIGALLASQENMVNRKNSFQLYGADFLIMDDLSVWLIEINTNPRLHPPSSSVTEKLYPEVIEDTMKDRRKNKKATRGKFECIFKQRNPFHGHAFGKAASLGIRGKALFSTQGSLRKP